MSFWSSFFPLKDEYFKLNREEKARGKLKDKGMACNA